MESQRHIHTHTRARARAHTQTVWEIWTRQISPGFIQFQSKISLLLARFLSCLGWEDCHSASAHTYKVYTYMLCLVTGRGGAQDGAHDQFGEIKFIFHFAFLRVSSTGLHFCCILMGPLCSCSCHVIYGTLLLESFDVIDSARLKGTQVCARPYWYPYYMHVYVYVMCTNTRISSHTDSLVAHKQLCTANSEKAI